MAVSRVDKLWKFQLKIQQTLKHYKERNHNWTIAAGMGKGFLRQGRQRTCVRPLPRTLPHSLWKAWWMGGWKISLWILGRFRVSHYPQSILRQEDFIWEELPQADWNGGHQHNRNRSRRGRIRWDTFQMYWSSIGRMWLVWITNLGTLVKRRRANQTKVSKSHLKNHRNQQTRNPRSSKTNQRTNQRWIHS